MNKLKHILSTKDLSTEIIQKLFSKVATNKKQFENPTGRIVLKQKLTNKVLFKKLGKPSLLNYTIDTAAYHMGMHSIGADTDVSIKDLTYLQPDVLIFRDPEHEEDLSSSSIPIINAGCSGQDPLQAITYAFTIYSRFNKLNDLVILFGDIEHQLIRSIFYLFAKFKGIQFVFSTNSLLPDIRQHIKENDIIFAEVPFEDVSKAVHVADVVFGVSEEVSTLMKPYSTLLAVKPQNESDVRNAYYEQTTNMLFTQMGLLELLLKDF